MRVGWLMDMPDHTGGAELTQAEFRAAAPEDVEIVDCLPGHIADCNRYVIQNCMQYDLADLQQIEAPTFKYWHDVGPWMNADVRRWLDAEAVAICCSPLQAEYMGVEAVCIPPAVDLSRFEAAAEKVNGFLDGRGALDRKGAVSVGSWRNYGKAPHKAAEWAAGNGGIDFFGDGPFAPPSSRLIAYQGMPKLLASYKTFVFLPVVIEPFGRTVVEAWATGCEIVTNGLVGARYWIQENPAALETAADDFWAVILDG